MERIAQGQGKYTVRTCNFTIRYIYISSIVNEAIKTFKPDFFFFFLRKDFERTKNNKGNGFPSQKRLRGVKLVILPFDAFCTLKIFS